MQERTHHSSKRSPSPAASQRPPAGCRSGLVIGLLTCCRCSAESPWLSSGSSSRYRVSWCSGSSCPPADWPTPSGAGRSWSPPVPWRSPAASCSSWRTRSLGVRAAVALAGRVPGPGLRTARGLVRRRGVGRRAGHPGGGQPECGWCGLGRGHRRRRRRFGWPGAVAAASRRTRSGPAIFLAVALNAVHLVLVALLVVEPARSRPDLRRLARSVRETPRVMPYGLRLARSRPHPGLSGAAWRSSGRSA